MSLNYVCQSASNGLLAWREGSPTAKGRGGGEKEGCLLRLISTLRRRRRRNHGSLVSTNLNIGCLYFKSLCVRFEPLTKKKKVFLCGSTLCLVVDRCFRNNFPIVSPCDPLTNPFPDP